MLSPVDDFVLYYGTEIPDIHVCRKLKNKAIVLQWYHPLCIQGLFAEFFPDCQRYIYWNCTRIHEDEYEQCSKNLKTLSYDSHWKTYVLDIKHDQEKDYIIAKAKEALTSHQIHGLFVDDLDTWGGNPLQQNVLLELFSSLEKEIDRKFSYFINRGFPFWHRLKNIDCIVVENLSLADVFSVKKVDLKWLDEILSMNFKVLNLRTNKVPVFTISYNNRREDEAALDEFIKNKDVLEQKRISVYTDLKGMISKTRYIQNQINTWDGLQ